jgi:membrane dipeptidase
MRRSGSANIKGMKSALTRREALAAGIAAAAGLSLAKTPITIAAAASGFNAERYSKATIIDALGGPGGVDPSIPEGTPLQPKDLADVRASGVTAVNLTVNLPGNGTDRFAKTIENIAGIERELTLHPDVLLKILNARDVPVAKSTRRLGLIYGCQDTSMLDGDLTRLATFYNLGVRICQPTYNRRNLIGDGCMETADGGLSKLGYDFVAEVNRLNILLDLSHAGPRTIAEGIAASKAPMAITHTACRALVDLPRNTYDKDLKALADRGGVAGIYFMPFLRLSGQPHAEDVIRHIEHAVDVCGEDHVGLGTDGTISGALINDALMAAARKEHDERVKAGISAPGETAEVIPLVPEYNDPRRFMRLADDLARRGWSSSRIEKLLGQNFARLFTDVWTAAA